jgi:hypothetical protein
VFSDQVVGNPNTRQPITILRRRDDPDIRHSQIGCKPDNIIHPMRIEFCKNTPHSNIRESRQGTNVAYDAIPRPFDSAGNLIPILSAAGIERNREVIHSIPKQF